MDGLKIEFFVYISMKIIFCYHLLFKKSTKKITFWVKNEKIKFYELRLHNFVYILQYNVILCEKMRELQNKVGEILSRTCCAINSRRQWRPTPHSLISTSSKVSLFTHILMKKMCVHYSYFFIQTFKAQKGRAQISKIAWYYPD